ncbi:hypothetical protein D3C81_1361950 [compost metagenome]
MEGQRKPIMNNQELDKHRCAAQNLNISHTDPAKNRDSIHPQQADKQPDNESEYYSKYRQKECIFNTRDVILFVFQKERECILGLLLSVNQAAGIIHKLLNLTVFD